jgi:hypothetical protein
VYRVNEEIIPSGEMLIKQVVKESGFDYKKPPERKNVYYLVSLRLKYHLRPDIIP